MPSTITHEYHYRDIYQYTTDQFKNSFDIETYRKYSVFAQGHDALFFLDFWNLLEQKNIMIKLNIYKIMILKKYV